MITNFLIPAHPSLQPFVDNYILSTSNNEPVTFSGGWPASNETSLVFYMGDTPVHAGEHASSLLSGQRNYLIGLLTRYNGTTHFNGRYHTFIIQFKANGFHKIFCIPMPELTDKIFTAEDVFGKQTNDLQNQLLNTVDIQQMARFADAFLLSFLRQNKEDPIYDGITAVSKELYNTTHLLSVPQYAAKANMSVRNFERRFTQQVGISPKLYAKLLRFNEAIKIKLLQPEKNWTFIAYECGYFDQTHFIKDFRQFTNVNPGDFFRKNKELNRPQLEAAQPGNSNLNQLTNQLPQEEYVFVKRTAL